MALVLPGNNPDYRVGRYRNPFTQLTNRQRRNLGNLAIAGAGFAGRRARDQARDLYNDLYDRATDYFNSPSATGPPRPTSMPKRKRSNGSSQASKRARRAGVTYVPRSLTFIPPKVKRKLTWCKFNAFTTSGTAQTATGLKFYPNNLRYPFGLPGDISKPGGFDQMIDLYDKWVVTGATVRAEITTEHGGAVIATGLNYFDDITTTFTSPDTYVEQPVSSYRVASPSVQNASPSLRLDFRKLMDVRNFLDQAELHGGASDNPSRQCVVNLWFSTLSGTAVSAGCVYILTIDFDVLYFQPKVAAAS